MGSGLVNPPKADILAIDDTPENLNLLSAMLTQQGYKVRSVTKGATGLRAAQVLPPDLILLDINMPQMNGYEVCQQLKADDRTAQIPVIFISALEDALDKVQAFAVGGVDYITKPFHVEEVLARIETHLTMQKQALQLQAQNIQLQQEIRDRDRAEEKFSKAFRSSPNPIAIATISEGRFIDVNPSFLQMSGYSLNEVVEKTFAGLRLIKDTDAIANILAVVKENGALHNREFELQTKLGECKVVLLSIELIELAGVECALFIANDITERKRLENEFISLVSHELRTPLTSLMGALDLLGTGQLGILNDKGRNVLNIATTNTERLIRLVNDILDLERMKSGTISLHKTKCSVVQVLTQAIEAMQAMAELAKVELICQPVDAEIYADSDRLLQVLTNLLSNAIKFSHPGGKVWLTAELTTNFSSKALLIKVIDRGRGIPKNKLQLIFERFQQVDASDSRHRGGTGLGLTICRNLVEQHSGKIWAESNLGQGSTFYIVLPLDGEGEIS